MRVDRGRGVGRTRSVVEWGISPRYSYSLSSSAGSRSALLLNLGWRVLSVDFNGSVVPLGCATANCVVVGLVLFPRC